MPVDYLFRGNCGIILRLDFWSPLGVECRDQDLRGTETVANIKSQKKRILTNEKARQRNRAVKSELKTATKRVHAAIEAENRDEAVAAAQNVSKLLDKAVSKGVVHKNQAANRKSGLMKAANAVK